MEKDLEFYLSLFNIKDPTLLENKILDSAEEIDKNEVESALKVAQSAHSTQTRIEGTPYILHPLRISYFLISCAKPERELILTAILHDVLEDSPQTTTKALKEMFGTKVTENINQLSKKIAFTGAKKDEKEYFDSFIKASSDTLVVNIKLLDRIDNLLSLTQIDQKTEKVFIEKYIQEAEKYFLNFSNADQRLESLLRMAIQYAKDFFKKSN